jgi:hypothetical protein
VQASSRGSTLPRPLTERDQGRLMLFTDVERGNGSTGVARQLRSRARWPVATSKMLRLTARELSSRSTHVTFSLYLVRSVHPVLGKERVLDFTQPPLRLSFFYLSLLYASFGRV